MTRIFFLLIILGLVTMCVLAAHNQIYQSGLKGWVGDDVKFEREDTR